MKRRTLLKAALLAPLAPLLSRLPAAAAPARVMTRVTIGWDPAAGPDFAGYWVGIEGAHGLELIQIEKFKKLYGQKVLTTLLGDGDGPE